MKQILKIANGLAEIWLTGFVVQNEDKMLYEWYGYDAFCPKDVIEALQNLAGQPVTVKIDGYGGSMYAGSVIYSEFMQYSGEVTFLIMGLSASALSTIPMASAKKGNKCLMSPMAMMMMHNAQGEQYGDYRDMEHEADALRVANKTVVNAYRIKTGMDEAEIQTMMDAETWLDAATALEKRLIDGILFTDEMPEQDPVPPVAVNAMRNGYRSICNSIRPHVRQMREAFTAAHPQAPDPPPDDIENPDIDLALAELELEQLRFGG